MTIKVLDLFNGTSGTDISAHTPDTDVVGSGWSDSEVNEVELDGVGGIKFSTANDNCWIDSGVTDQYVTTNFNAGGVDNRIGVILRADGNLARGTNYYFNFKPGTATGTLAILKRIGGSLTSIASKDLSLSTSTTYELKCQAIGSTLNFIVDGVTELTLTDSSITSSTNAGLIHALYTNGNARFYDFEVDDGVSAGITLTASLGTINYTSQNATVSLTGSVDIQATLGTITYNSYNVTVGVGEGQLINNVTGYFADDIYSAGFKPNVITVNFK